MASVPFTVCDLATKRILRMGQCRPSDLALQASSGEVVIAAQATDQESQRLNAAGDALENSPPPSLATLRARAQALLDRRHEDEIASAIDFGGLRIPTCPLCRSRIYRAASSSIPLRIRSRSGVWVSLTGQDAAALAALIDAQDQSVDSRHAELSDIISAATTRPQLAALLPVIRQFWP